MASELPPDAEYTQRGTLWVAADDEEMQEICRKHSVYTENGIPSEVIDAQSLARIEPALRPGLAGGLLMTEDAVVSPQVAARFLLQQALAGKVTLFRETAASMDSGRVAAKQRRRTTRAHSRQRGRGVGFRVDARTSRWPSEKAIWRSPIPIPAFCATRWSNSDT